MASWAVPAFSQGLSDRLVKVIVPYSAGSGMDIIARILAPRLQARWNQPFVVENISGASGNIGAAQFAKMTTDGHAVMVNTNTIVTSPVLYPALSWDLFKSFAPVTSVAFSGLVLAVHKDVPAGNLKEFMTWVHQRPGTLNYGSPGMGTQQHLAMELMKMQAGFDIQHVPYKTSAPAYTDMIAGVIPTMFIPIHAGVRMKNAGQVKIIGCALVERHALFPDIPTLHEFGLKDFEVDVWYGVWMPGGASTETVARYNKEVRDIVATSEVREALAKQGLATRTGTPEEFSRMIRSEYNKWEKVIRDAKIKAE